MRGCWVAALGLILASACGGTSPPKAEQPAQGRDATIRVTDYAADTSALALPVAVTGTESSESVSSAGLPRLALVIDDLGFRRDRIQQLLALGLTMTYAVLPAESRTPEVVAILQQARVPIIVHMPMQPRDYPRAQPGSCALMLAEGSAWESTLHECASRVAGAQGMNNHMGSAFTEDSTGMVAVANYLRDRNWFFLDSVTSGRSVATEVMRAHGVAVLSRDVFLDDTRDEVQIASQLQKAFQHARKHGSAVAIGHPYPETIRALAAARDSGEFSNVELVAAGTLAR